jgi:pSer/pThr/pTyr-binding forkhead associated (FHA) protein
MEIANTYENLNHCRVVISCLTPLCASKFSEGFVSMEISKFPFRIGRDAYGDIGSGAQAFKNDFSIADGEPFQVSRKHCLIEKEVGLFYIRDTGSSLGTIVNGTPIGTKCASLSEVLKEGKNTLVLGSERSPFKFEIEVA